MSTLSHEPYDELLERMERGSSVSRNVLARVLVRVMISAPNDIARADIAKGAMLPKPSLLNASAVSKAIRVLIDEGFVTEDGPRPDELRAGRPIKPLRLGGSDRTLMGIKVVHFRDRPVRLHGVLTSLRVDENSDVLVEQPVDLPPGTELKHVPEHIRELHDDLLKKAPRGSSVFGIGVDVASHVHQGNVIGATHVGLSREGSFPLLERLQPLVTAPVVVDNDVNVLAVRETYRPFAGRHVAVVGVMDDGVGAALIIEGHLYRGGGGMAAEPGHQLTAALPPFPTDRENSLESTFRDPCHCSGLEHVDCYAVPARMTAQLGVKQLREATEQPARGARGDDLTPEGAVVRTAGTALGQGVASIINVVNPSRVLLIVPGDLAPLGTQGVSRANTVTESESPQAPGRGRATVGSAGMEYLSAVEAAVDTYSFSRGARDARAGGDHLTVRVLDPDQAERQGALCAAIRAMDAFIQHARGRDRCRDFASDESRRG